MTGPGGGTWWEEEPERKLTGIVLPSWGDDTDTSPGAADRPRGDVDRPGGESDRPGSDLGRPRGDVEQAGRGWSPGATPAGPGYPPSDQTWGQTSNQDPGGPSDRASNQDSGGPSGWASNGAAGGPSGRGSDQDSGGRSGWASQQPSDQAAGGLWARSGSPLTDPLTDPLTGPLDDGWLQHDPTPLAGQRLVPVVPSGPPPAWPPADFATEDHPQARIELPPLAATTAPAYGDENALVSQAAKAEAAGPRRDFPRYIAGELVVPGTTDPQATAETRSPAEPLASYAALPADTLTTSTWTPQPTSSPPTADRYATPPPRPPAAPPGEPDAPAGGSSPSLPGVQFTAPARRTPPRPAPLPAEPPATTARTMPAATMPPATMPPGPLPAGVMPAGVMPAGVMPAAAMPSGTMAPAVMPSGAGQSGAGLSGAVAGALTQATVPILGAAPHPAPPHPTAPPPGVPQDRVPPPPRPTPPSIPPAGHTMQPATMPPAGHTMQPAAMPPAGHTMQPATMPPATMPHTAMRPATMPPTTQHPIGALGALPADTVTAMQPAVPAVVHAAQQSVSSAPPAAGGPDRPAPPAPAKKGRDSAPHPAFPDATARTMRILPIAADLLPLEITELRRLRMVRRLVIAGIVAVAVALLGWYVVADGKTDQAQTELNAVQDSRRDLNRKKATYTELEKVRQQRKDVTTELAIVMERDLSWATLLTSLQQAAPAGVGVKSVTGSLSSEGADTTGDVIGEITLTGSAPSKSTVATYVDTLGGVTGLANPFPTDTTENESGLTFTIRVDVTKASLGGRFTPSTASPSASGGK